MRLGTRMDALALIASPSLFLVLFGILAEVCGNYFGANAARQGYAHVATRTSIRVIGNCNSSCMIGVTLSNSR